MYCKKCGKEIDKDSDFCKYCGSTQTLKTESITHSDKNPIEKNNETNNDANNDKNAKYESTITRISKVLFVLLSFITATLIVLIIISVNSVGSITFNNSKNSYTYSKGNVWAICYTDGKSSNTSFSKNKNADETEILPDYMPFTTIENLIYQIDYWVIQGEKFPPNKAIKATDIKYFSGPGYYENGYSNLYLASAQPKLIFNWFLVICDGVLLVLTGLIFAFSKMNDNIKSLK